MTTVYVEAHQKCLEEVFTAYGWEVVSSLNDADVVVLMGGADINPEWYGQKPHKYCHHFTDNMDNRTAFLTKHAFQYNKPIIGICRGAQFINAVVGGSMYQDVDGHNKGHLIKDISTGKIHAVNSIHHQMMIPAKDIAEVVAVAIDTDCSIRHYMDGDIPACVFGKEEPEVEVIWYHHVSGLCYQAHPEYAPLNSDTRQYFYSLLNRFYPNLSRVVS